LVHLCSQQIAGSDNEEWLGIKVGLFAVLYAVTRGRTDPETCFLRCFEWNGNVSREQPRRRSA